MFAATLVVPLDSLASIFAPLLGLDAVMRAVGRRNRLGLPPIRRVAALAQSGFTVLAVCAPDLIVAWLAIMAALATALLPALSRRWGGAVLAFLGAGLALFGMLLVQAAPPAGAAASLAAASMTALAAVPPVLGYFSLFAGFAAMAAVVPDLAVVLAILILRLGDQSAWPDGAAAIGAGLAVASLLICAGLLTTRSRRTTLLLLSQASIAALAICIGQAEGRFAALVLLVLLILSRSAARFTSGPAATLAIAGLGGIPPLGVFPGLVLVILTMSAHNPWFLLPVGAALIPMARASVPRHLPDFSPRAAIPSIAWLPLVLAILAGYFAPEGLVQWWRILTAGRL
jgi:hypothetical protein